MRSCDLPLRSRALFSFAANSGCFGTSKVTSLCHVTVTVSTISHYRFCKTSDKLCHVTVTVSGGWSAQRLKALRKKRKLTQEQLADLAGLARTTIVHLERETKPRTMTPHYAGKLAPVLKVKPAELLPPTGDASDSQDPLVLLRKLGETVETQQKTIDELHSRLETLEHAGETNRPATRAGQ